MASVQVRRFSAAIYRHESVLLFRGIPIFFSSKFVVSEIIANLLRSQNALGGGGG